MSCVCVGASVFVISNVFANETLIVPIFRRVKPRVVRLCVETTIVVNSKELVTTV